MFRKIAAVAVLFASMFAAVRTDAVGYTAAQRAAIRARPITERPDRPGHFYGNTIRALNRLGIVR
jgi:hypothetical protein